MQHLPPQVDTALTRLNAAGYEAYIVGGCVRDALLGRTRPFPVISRTARSGAAVRWTPRAASGGC